MPHRPRCRSTVPSAVKRRRPLSRHYHLRVHLPLPPFSPIEDVLEDLRNGKMIILTDDEGRENEGDLVLPAQFCSPSAITFMLTHARGYLCLSMSEADCDRLDLSPQSAVNTSKRGTAFTISVDGHPRHGFTTGVSATERSRCIQMMIDKRNTSADFVRPGHINPLRSRNGGVLVRTGQTEGSLDLCRMAGLYDAALIIEIMRDDGEMARVPDLAVFSVKHNIKVCSVAQIIQHRLHRESLVKRIGPPGGRSIRTRHGTFQALMFESLVDPLPHLVLTAGGVGSLDPSGSLLPTPAPTLVRMHRRNLLGDVFGDLDSAPGGTTGDLLNAALEKISREQHGALVYLRTTASGHTPPASGTGDSGFNLEGQLQTLRSSGEQPNPDEPALLAATEAMPQREFGIGVQILRHLGLSKIRLISNSRRELPGLEAFGLEIVEHVRIDAK